MYFYATYIDQDPDVGGGAASMYMYVYKCWLRHTVHNYIDFEVKPQESTAQSGGTATVASELSAPQSDANEVRESRGSKVCFID